MSAEIYLQPIVDHTIERLVAAQEDVFRQCVGGDETIKAIIKWGCDGSSSHIVYKQTFQTENAEFSNSDMFIILL